MKLPVRLHLSCLKIQSCVLNVAIMANSSLHRYKQKQQTRKKRNFELCSALRIIQVELVYLSIPREPFGQLIHNHL